MASWFGMLRGDGAPAIRWLGSKKAGPEISEKLDELVAWRSDLDETVVSCSGWDGGFTKRRVTEDEIIKIIKPGGTLGKPDHGNASNRGEAH